MTDTTVQLRLSPETKEQWQQAVADSPAHKTISGLIRVAVAEYITDDRDDVQQSQQNSIDKEDLEEIKQQIKDLDRQIAKVRVEQPELDDFDQILLDRMEWLVENNRPEPDRY